MCFQIVQPPDRPLAADVPLAGPAAEPAADPRRPASRQQQPADPVPGRRDVLRLAAGYDIGAGLLLALATTYKVTPALFFVYFAYKRSWRTVIWGMLGMGIFLLIVPSLVIGPQFNGECLGMWWHRMITPFVAKGATEPAGDQPVARRRASTGCSPS